LEKFIIHFTDDLLPVPWKNEVALEVQIIDMIVDLHVKVFFFA
jgi:hypothetical protein